MNKQYYQSRTGFITQSALIAALYVVLTMIVAPIAFGPIQFRVSEVLCVLPYFLTSAVPGVTIGCFLANLLCGAASLDVVFGSIATLIGAVGSYYLGKKNKWLVCVPPILSNTIIVPHLCLFVFIYVYLYFSCLFMFILIYKYIIPTLMQKTRSAFKKIPLAYSKYARGIFLLHK